jgi:Holliday junction resolvase RusA-like endonuclease
MITTVFTVNGAPRPQPRPRFIKGHVVSTADKETRLWRAKVVAVCAELPKLPDKTPLSVEMVFRMPTPKSNRTNLPHLFTPDVDNLAKLILDAMQDANMLPNDSAVSRLTVLKRWALPGDAGVSVQVSDDLPSGNGPQTPPRWLTGGSDPDDGE